MFPLAAASLNVMLNPESEYPKALPALNPVRFSSTAKPPFGPTRKAYKSPLNPPVMSSDTVTWLMDPLNSPTAMAVAKPLALLSDKKALSATCVLHDCWAQAVVVVSKLTAMIGKARFIVVFNFLVWSMHIPCPVVALRRRVDVGETHKALVRRRIGDLWQPVDRRCQIGRQIQRIIVAGDSKEGNDVRHIA